MDKTCGVVGFILPFFLVAGAAFGQTPYRTDFKSSYTPYEREFGSCTLAGPSQRSVTGTGLSYTASLKCGAKVTASLTITADVSPATANGVPSDGPGSNHDTLTTKSPVVFTVSGTFTPAGNTGLPVPTKVIILPIAAGNKLCPDVSATPKATMICSLTTLGRTGSSPGQGTDFVPFEVSAGVDGFTYTADLAPAFAESLPAPDTVAITNVIPAGNFLAAGTYRFGGTATATLNSSFVGYGSVEVSDASGKLLGRSDTDSGNTRLVTYGNSVTNNLSTPFIQVPTSGQIFLRAVLRTPLTATPVYSTPIAYELNKSEDLIVSALHLVQVIQTPGSQTPLIAGKRTMARIFVNSLGLSVAGVSATLQCRAQDGKFYTSAALTPPIIADHIAAVPPPNAVPDLSGPSIDMPVPEPCSDRISNVQFDAEVVVPPGVTDPNPDNNVRSYLSPFLRPPKALPFRIGWVRVGVQPPGKAAPEYASTAVGGYQKFLEKIYPVPDLGVSYFPLTTDYPVWTKAVNSNAEWSALIDDLAAYFLLADAPEGQDFDQVAAWIPANTDTGLLGLANTLWHGGSGRVVLMGDEGEQKSGVTLAHELAHNLGLRHTNLPDPEGFCKDVSKDSQAKWPFPDNTIQTYGYDLTTKTLVTKHLYDVMTYCPERFIWISPYTYQVLLQNDLQPTGGLPPAVTFSDLPHRAPDKAAAGPQDLWLVSGLVRKDGTAQLDPLLRVTSARTPAVSDPSGTYCLQFTAAAATLSSHCFTLPFVDNNENPLPERSFSYLVPVAPNAAGVSLAAGTTVLASLAPAGGALQLAITSPAAGDKWSSGSRTITWNFSGGSPARFAVQYSSDGGTSRLPLAANLKTPSVTVNTARLQGSDNMRFRVMAGVGMSTASAEVGPVTLTQTPRISAPAGTFDLHNAVTNQPVDRQLVVSGPIMAGLKSTGVYFTAPGPLEKAPALPGKLVKKLDADGPLMLGEFSSKGEEVDHLVLVNLSLQRTTIVRMQDLLKVGTLETYSPEDSHLDKCEMNLHLTPGQGVLIKVTR